MTAKEEYLRRLHAVLDAVAGSLEEDERAAVERLIDHDEGGEAMLTLAWILVEGKHRVAVDAIREIRELARGLVDESDLPPDLDKCAIG